MQLIRSHLCSHRGRSSILAWLRMSGCCVFLLCTSLVTGCGWFSDDKGFFVNPTDDYIDARQGPGLVIPEDLDQTIEDPFPIPVIPEQQNARFYSGRPPLPGTIYSSDNRDEIRIQRLGDRIWLVVPEPPTTVWPKIKQFLADNGVAVGFEAPANGRITTEWFAVADEPYRDVVRALLREAISEEPGGRFTGQERLLLRVEQGVRELTSEIHVRHQSDRGAIVNPDAIVDLEPIFSELIPVERDFLNELGAYIAARVAEQTVSMVAREIAGQEKAEIGRNQAGDPVLTLFLDAERAWATLDQALDAAAVDVIELDRVAGTCLIHIPETAFTGPVTEQRRGFFRRLNPFKGTRRSEDAADILLRVLQEDERRHAITAHGVGGEPVSDDYRQQVLILIREYAG